MNTKQQGDIGVAMAIAYYTLNEYVVSTPLTDNARYDLVVEKDCKFQRVQCKSSGYIEGSSYKVALRTKGGNKSGTTSKLISSEECDILFVYTMDGSWWEFPPEEYNGKVSLTLGPSKQKYKVR